MTAWRDFVEHQARAADWLDTLDPPEDDAPARMARVVVEEYRRESLAGASNLLDTPWTTRWFDTPAATRRRFSDASPRGSRAANMRALDELRRRYDALVSAAHDPSWSATP